MSCHNKKQDWLPQDGAVCENGSDLASSDLGTNLLAGTKLEVKLE